MKLKLALPLLTLFLISGLAQAAEPRTSPPTAGTLAPDFTLQDQNGQAVTLSASRGERPVVLVFYRGYW